MSRGHVSLSVDTFDRLNAYCEARGVSMAGFVESLFAGEIAAPVSVAQQLAEAHAAIRDLLGAFERDFAHGCTTDAQQYCLRRAREVIASHGNAEALASEVTP